jgi:hypothetical protein
VFSGETLMSSCFADTDNNVVSYKRLATLNALDNIVYRIPEKQYCDAVDPDVYIIFNIQKNEFKISLSLLARKQLSKFPIDSVISFTITEYNDPYKPIQVIKYPITKLLASRRAKKYVGTNMNISIFTKRIFKCYVFEKI